MTYSPTLLHLIEDLRIRLVNEITDANSTVFENVNHLVEFTHTHFNDADDRIWYRFHYNSWCSEFPIWCRLNSEGEFVSIVDPNDAQYYTR